MFKLSSDSKDQFSLVADEFVSMCILLKSLCSHHFLRLDPQGPPVRNTQNLDIIFHLNVVGVFEVCLELPSDLKDQFGFVAGEFFELEHTRKSLVCLIPV